MAKSKQSLKEEDGLVVVRGDQFSRAEIAKAARRQKLIDKMTVEKKTALIRALLLSLIKDCGDPKIHRWLYRVADELVWLSARTPRDRRNMPGIVGAK
jgi:hypothetical protein